MPFSAESDLIVDETLPSKVTVTEGQRAEFNCDALTTNPVRIIGSSPFTVAILVHAPPYPGPMQCYNCSFTRDKLTDCHQDDQGCLGLQVTNSFSGSQYVHTHRLTAVWNKTDRNLSGSEVVCAIAARGATQWAHTATLTVLPASPGPLPHRQLVWGGVAGGMVVVVMVLCGGVCLLSLALWFRHKHQTAPLQLDQCMLHDLWGGRFRCSCVAVCAVPLTGSSQPSSGSSTPTTTPATAQVVPLIEVSLSQGRMDPGQYRHVPVMEQYRDSMDSGLDVNSTAGDIEAAKVYTKNMCIIVNYLVHHTLWV